MKESNKNRFVSDSDGKIIDTQTTPKGAYMQPDGCRTDVLQDKSHYNKVLNLNHGTSHTHELKININSDGSKIFKVVDRINTHLPTFEEVENIKNGIAIKN